MKKILALLCVWLTSILSNSLTADCFPSYAATTFDGFYLGAHGGFGNLRSSTQDPNRYFESFTHKSNDTNWIAGFQVGYDWLCCRSLFGLVVDWSWSHAKTKTSLDFPPPQVIDYFHRTELRWFSTFRGRAGLALSNSLFYITGGAALADIRQNFSTILTSPAFFEVVKTHKRRWGWSVGVGTEFPLWCRLNLVAEVLYLNFNRNTTVLSDTFTQRESNSVWVGRVGINYRFSLCGLGW